MVELAQDSGALRTLLKVCLEAMLEVMLEATKDSSLILVEEIKEDLTQINFLKNNRDKKNSPKKLIYKVVKII